MEDRFKRALQTQGELVEAVRILASVLFRMGAYIYENSNNPDLKAKLLVLGEEIKRIRMLRR